MKHWIWTTGFSPERSTSPASGEWIRAYARNFYYLEFFDFLLYISGDFGYNKTKYAKI